MHLPRRAVVLTVVAFVTLVGALTGCAADVPAPAEPTAMFASDEEAFAAAEATYRAYVDALNEVDLADPATFEPSFELTTGALNAADRKSASELHAEMSSMTGAQVIDEIVAGDITPSHDSITLMVCLDVSDIQLLDAQGTSLVDPERRPVQAISVTAVPSPRHSGSLAISQVTARSGEPSCG